LEELGRLDEAEANYRQAIALKSELLEARYNLGVLLFTRHQYSLAAEQFELVNSQKSRQFAIKCSYRHDDQTVFYEKLDVQINQGEINAVIGSLISCSEIEYGIKKSNPFCNDPLRYVVKTDLKDQYDFENIFIKTAKNVLIDNSVRSKAKGQLTNGTPTSGNIFSVGNVVKTEIESIIHSEIEKYWNHFIYSEEGFIKNWPSSYTLFGWLISMKSGGKLDSHMHDTSWLAG